MSLTIFSFFRNLKQICTKSNGSHLTNNNNAARNQIGKHKKLAKKKEKLYCICRTPYDDTK